MSRSEFLPDSPLAVAVAERDGNTLAMVRSALASGSVLLAYQPVMQARDPRKVAFQEGLLRILDETGRVIPAKDFIATIEPLEEGRMMDCLALEHGVQTLKTHPGLRLSINMSARSILYEPWEFTLEKELRRDPTLAERLIIEITESSAMEMPHLVVDFMARLHRKGVSFALDDFGAGYTAFRYFKDFYFDIVKIDASFIRGIDQDIDNQVLTNALVSISQQFDMFTVAEGVEHPKEADHLIKSGLDCLQGYLFGAPTIHPNWLSSHTGRRVG